MKINSLTLEASALLACACISASALDCNGTKQTQRKLTY